MSGIYEDLGELRLMRTRIVKLLHESAETALIASSSYSDGQGSQSVTRRSPKELMSWLKDLDKEIQYLEQKLRGGGLRVFSSNRHPFN